MDEIPKFIESDCHHSAVGVGIGIELEIDEQIRVAIDVMEEEK